MRKIYILCVILLWTITAIAQENITLEKKFSQYKDGDKLELSVKGGASINIRGQKDQAGVTIRFVCPKEYLVTFKETKGVLLVDGNYSESLVSFRETIQVNIQLPVNFDLKLENDGGRIQLANLKGDFKGKNWGGDINIVGLEGKIDFLTNGGNISIQQGNLEGKVRTSGGNIEIIEVGGKLKAISDGGRVVYRNVYKRKYDGEVQLTTLGGDIEIDEAPYGASVNTQGGNIIINKAGRHINAFTKGGNIILRKIRGNIDAETYSGNIETEILSVDKNQKKQSYNLESKSGDVALYIPKNLEATIDVALTYTRDSMKKYIIDSELDLTIKKTPEWDFSQGLARKTVYGKGQIGNGKHTIRISTVNGNIFLKRGRMPKLRNPPYSAYYISYEEIQRSYVDNALALIKTKRPLWFVSAVYVNDQMWGTKGSLSSIPIGNIREITYLKATEAFARFGFKHTGGVVLVTLF